MLDMPSYAIGLFLVCIMAFITGSLFENSREQLWRSAGAILANWCVGMLYVYNTGNTSPWAFNIFIDSVAAATVLFHPAGRAQVYIGLFFAFQLAGHIAFGGRELLGLYADPFYYYDAITLVAWGQLLAMGVWGAGIWGKAILHSIRGFRDTDNHKQGNNGGVQ